MFKFISFVVIFLTASCHADLVQKGSGRTPSSCIEPAVPNVCPAGVLGSVHLPHPVNPAKFLMCRSGGRMYIVSCPPGEVYMDGKKDCVSTQTTPPPTMNPYNPCTAANIAAVKLIFPYPGYNTRYIKCLGVGTPSVVNCAVGYVYDPARDSRDCVAATPTLPVTKMPTTTAKLLTTRRALYNPCNLKSLNINNLFFPYKDDRTKFIHCDLTGAAYVMQCPEGLVWSQTAISCIESVIAGRR